MVASPRQPSQRGIEDSCPINVYLANPLKRLGKDRYAAYWGEKADYWVDGRKVGSALRHIPVMAAQLTIGIWLPQWGGPAPWRESSASFSTVKVWEYDDPGDVRGVLAEDVPANF